MRTGLARTFAYGQGLMPSENAQCEFPQDVGDAFVMRDFLVDETHLAGRHI